MRLFSKIIFPLGFTFIIISCSTSKQAISILEDDVIKINGRLEYDRQKFEIYKEYTFEITTENEIKEIIKLLNKSKPGDHFPPVANSILYLNVNTPDGIHEFTIYYSTNLGITISYSLLDGGYRGRFNNGALGEYFKTYFLNKNITITYPKEE